jgi:hypothetical protein
VLNVAQTPEKSITWFTTIYGKPTVVNHFFVSGV